MDRIINLVRALLGRKGENWLSDSVEELRLDFRERYHSFKLLLNANNRALEIMTELEEALRGTRPFGMNFVFAKCTAVSTSVWQIIKNLNDLTPNKYAILYDRFKEIQISINPFVHRKRSSKEGSLVLPLEEITRDFADQVGSKMVNLAEIKNRILMRIPSGFAITVNAFERFMDHNDLQSEIDRRIQASDADRLDEMHRLSAGIQQLIIGASLPEELETAILEQYRLMEEKEGQGATVAMRSSALGEDVVGITFAGQYRSVLNVSPEHVIQAYKEVVASKYSLQAMMYRLNRGIRDEDVAMGVGCIAMVDAVSGGVTYSSSPLDMRANKVITNAVWGLPKAVVDGSSATDLFIVSRIGPMEIQRKEIARKEERFDCYPEEGVCRMDQTGDKADLPSLEDRQVLELARIAAKLEEHYGLPQDIEWAIEEDGSIVLLQCRPLQVIDVNEAADAGLEDEGTDAVILQGGNTASPGAAAGPVYLVKKDMDVLRFPENAVLVAAQSAPRLASLMNRAVAIVTEQGSIAGHLANVAREFHVPALFGVEGAMTRLMNDELITVNADTRRIYEGRVEDLLERRIKPANLMEGSPVYETLRSAVDRIVPLNLLDPDAPAFRAENCKTFHDITRFCHEKAVKEMFQFGKDHHFPERSSKQLVCQVPMQWWVLNLDDGFQEEVEGKYVHIDNIVSIPMLALWEGITAVPWKGPPAMDGKGFMSVMFQATTNPALVTGVRSRYADRNYFMISKNYCSLNSRMGFHFCIIETLVSDRAGENYISFQFKGGAADDQRRQRRILFVGDILEGYGFRVELKGDHLLARLENHEREHMEKSLRIIGYLTMHTRQLDMIMLNDASVNYYRSKIEKDIREIVQFQ